MKRGDEYMHAGMWDQAAVAYAEATRLEPSDARAAIKLREARRRQAQARISQAEAVASRQDYRGALVLGGQALAFDPANLGLQRRFNAIVEAAVQYASAAAARGASQEALDLATRVLQVAPQHAGAQAIAQQVRQRLADDRFARANAFLKNGLRGNELVELAACLDYVPSYPQAQLRMHHAYSMMRDELAERVALEEGETDDGVELSAVLTAEQVAGALRTAWPVQVTDRPDPRSTLIVSAADIHFSFDRGRRSMTQSCDYVCGTDHVPNPDHADAERVVADAERRLASEERDAAGLEEQVNRAQHDLDEAERKLAREEGELDRARRDLASCHRGRNHAKHPCRSERERVESEQRDVERARRHAQGPRQKLSRSRERWGRAREGVHDAREARSRALERMRSTPRTVAVDRMCPHTYPAQEHSIAGALSLDLVVREAPSGRQLVSLRPRRFTTERRWETYRAQPGRCPAVGKGPPARLPSEHELRGDLEAKLLAEVAQHVQDHIAGRLSSLYERARADEANGRIDEAIESYVRLMVAGGAQLDPQVRSHIDALLKRARGVNGIRVDAP